MSDVEPLIPLQDELNTRLSDRAYRVTMTSFRMWLGRGIEDFTKRPVGPGQMWATDNPSATIEAFGGDAATPSEAAHIEEVREALDKVSGVSPVAAGQIGGKIGNLTSAVALRLTLIALLARTDRKRAALTETLSKLVAMVLGILDRANTSCIRRLRGSGHRHQLADAAAGQRFYGSASGERGLKIVLGIPRETVLTELGYGEVGDVPADARHLRRSSHPLGDRAGKCGIGTGGVCDRQQFEMSALQEGARRAAPVSDRSKPLSLKRLCALPRRRTRPPSPRHCDFFLFSFLRRCFMSEAELEIGKRQKWPASQSEGVSPPLTQAALANAAARATATNSRRDLVEYLRLRRKSA